VSYNDFLNCVIHKDVCIDAEAGILQTFSKQKKKYLSGGSTVGFARSERLV
jgi:hypothetical protein